MTVGFAITEPEAQTIVHALRVAALQFRKDSEAFSSDYPGNERMRTGFLRQALEAEKLADDLEDRRIVQLTERELASW